jgi:hypothetical protein
MERLIVEHRELSERTLALQNYLGVDAFNLLPADTQNLMRDQHEHMSRYLCALEERMRLLGMDIPGYSAVAHARSRPAGELLDEDEGIEVRTTRTAEDTPIPFDEKPAPAPGTRYKPDGFA